MKHLELEIDQSKVDTANKAVDLGMVTKKNQGGGGVLNGKRHEGQ